MTAQPTTLTLSAFLTARLDADEAVARAATPGPWETMGGVSWVDGVDVFHPEEEGGTYVTQSYSNEPPWPPVPQDRASATVEDATHIARHDPARVLADVEAKRRIVEFAEDARAQLWPSSYALGSVLCLLALPYASHEDYRAEWAP